MKFATKLMRHWPFHLRHVATIPWEIKHSNFCSRYGRKCKHTAFQSPLCYSSTNVDIFGCLKIACHSPYWLQIKFFMSLFFWLFTFAVNLWHRKFVTADITAAFVNIQRGIQQRGQDFNKKKVCIWRGTQQRGWQMNFLRNVGQSVVLISC